MSKFDPRAFRVALEKLAAKKGIKFQVLFNMLRIEFNHRRPDKKNCLHLSNLTGDKISLSQETVAHINGCWFCSALVKSAWLQCASEDEQANAIEFVMGKLSIPGEHFEAKILDESAVEAGSPHLGYTETVCFNSLKPARRNHRKICKRCDLFMLILETIPLPDLS